jgi:hypothetical protein
VKTTKVKIGDRTEKIKAESEGSVRDIDRIVHNHTAFATFKDLVNAAGGYRPSIYIAGKSKQAKRELVYLTIEYNLFQEKRGDKRRVYCGDFQLESQILRLVPKDQILATSG